MIHPCYSKMVLWFYYCMRISKIIIMLLNSPTMVGAILIEICTSAPYRPGHWLLSDVKPVNYVVAYLNKVNVQRNNI